MGEQVGKKTTRSQQHHGYPDARTGRPTDRQHEITRRPDRCAHCRCAQVERLITQLRGARGQLPRSIHVEQRRTDALLSARKRRVLLPLSTCQGARQEVMLAPSGAVISSFCPLLLCPPPLLGERALVAFSIPTDCMLARHSEALETCVRLPGPPPQKKPGLQVASSFHQQHP